MSLTQTNIEIITRIDFESVSNGIKWYQMISVTTISLWDKEIVYELKCIELNWLNKQQ